MRADCIHADYWADYCSLPCSHWLCDRSLARSLGTVRSSYPFAFGEHFLRKNYSPKKQGIEQLIGANRASYPVVAVQSAANSHTDNGQTGVRWTLRANRSDREWSIQLSGSSVHCCGGRSVGGFSARKQGNLLSLVRLLFGRGESGHTDHGQSWAMAVMDEPANGHRHRLTTTEQLDSCSWPPS